MSDFEIPEEIIDAMARAYELTAPVRVQARNALQAALETGELLVLAREARRTWVQEVLNQVQPSIEYTERLLTELREIGQEVVDDYDEAGGPASMSRANIDRLREAVKRR